jgi:hypothetical protein
MFQSFKVINKDNADVRPILMGNIVQIINCNTTLCLLHSLHKVYKKSSMHGVQNFFCGEMTFFLGVVQSGCI